MGDHSQFAMLCVRAVEERREDVTAHVLPCRSATRIRARPTTPVGPPAPRGPRLFLARRALPASRSGSGVASVLGGVARSCLRCGLPTMSLAYAVPWWNLLPFGKRPAIIRASSSRRADRAPGDAGPVRLL